MKNVYSFLVIMVALIAMSFTNVIIDKPIKIDESSVSWKGYKVLGSHTGNINLKDGSLQFDENNNLTGGSFNIDMTTISCTDLEGKGAEKLVGHLSSDDFFGVATYPIANFTITKVISRGKPGEYKIVGDLTIKEQTNQIKFDALIMDGTAKADIVVDRSDYDVKYGSGSFFDGLGDKTIYDEFDLSIELAY